MLLVITRFGCHQPPDYYATRWWHEGRGASSIARLLWGTFFLKAIELLIQNVHTESGHIIMVVTIGFGNGFDVKILNCSLRVVRFPSEEGKVT